MASRLSATNKQREKAQKFKKLSKNGRNEDSLPHFTAEEITYKLISLTDTNYLINTDV